MTSLIGHALMKLSERRISFHGLLLRAREQFRIRNAVRSSIAFTACVVTCRSHADDIRGYVNLFPSTVVRGHIQLRSSL